MSFLGTTPTSDEVGILHFGMTPLVSQQAAFSGTTTTGTTIVAAPPAGFQVAVMQIVINSSATITALVLESTTTTAITTGAISLTANTPLVLPYSPLPWITSASGEGIKATWTTAATLSGTVTYVLQPLPAAN